MSSASSKLTFCIDGNIGSGKSTQIKKLEGALPEPIDEWPLDLFYGDKKRWSFLLQLSILRSFINMKKHKKGIFERSPESSIKVFWKMLVDDNVVNPTENDVCSYFYDTTGWSPDVHIYIRTNPEVCYERICSRTQTGDNGITLEYLNKLHEYYEEYIKTRTSYVIDGHQDPEEIHKQIKEIIRIENAKVSGTHEKGNEM